jgi:uncharacterized protein
MATLYTAEFWIENLALLPHPEGGFFKENYRSTEFISGSALPQRFHDQRCFSTAIYFLLRSEDRSVFHRIQSDEIWHFYAGTTLSIYILDDAGLTTLKLGMNARKGESLQVVVPAGKWFGAKVDDSNSYNLAGCTVAPGFDYKDFEMADRSVLLKTFPAHRDIIEKLT